MIVLFILMFMLMRKYILGVCRIKIFNKVVQVCEVQLNVVNFVLKGNENVWLVFIIFIYKRVVLQGKIKIEYRLNYKKYSVSFMLI